MTPDLPWLARVVPAVGWTLLHFVWQGALIAAVVAALLAALRRSSAAARYGVACGGLALATVAPVGTFAALWRSTHAVASSHNEFSDALLRPSPGPTRSVTASGVSPSRAPDLESNTSARAQQPARIAVADDGSVRNSNARLSALRRAIEPRLGWLVLAWAVGVGLGVLRLFGGWLLVQRLRRSGVRSAPAFWTARLAELARGLGVTRSICLLESLLSRTPTVVGWIRPTILLPATLLTGLPPRQVEAILAHELAHICRHDYAVNLLQALVETLLFYHPAAWWLSNRIRREREFCCDDLAVSVCGDRVTYARALAELESLRGAPSLAPAATGGALLPRIARILGVPHRGHEPAAGWAASMLLMIAGAGVAVASWLPQNGGQKPTASAAGQSTDTAIYVPIPPKSSTEPTTTVSGIVIDEDGNAVADARVVAAHGQVGAVDKTLTAKSTSDGTFVFEKLNPDGVWTFAIDDARFARHWQHSDGLGIPYDPMLGGFAGAPEIPIRLKAYRPRSLTGVVVNEGGSGVRDVKVTLCRELLPDGKTSQGWMAWEVQATTTDPDGRFRFERLRPGKAIFFLEHDDYAKTLCDAIEVEPGDAKFTIHSGLMLRGRVSVAGKPLANARLEVDSINFAHRNMGQWTVHTNDDGTFAVGNIADLAQYNYNEHVCNVYLAEPGFGGVGYTVSKDESGALPFVEIAAEPGEFAEQKIAWKRIGKGPDPSGQPRPDQPTGTAVIRATLAAVPVGEPRPIRMIAQKIDKKCDVFITAESNAGETVEFKKLVAGDYRVYTDNWTPPNHPPQDFHIEDGTTTEITLSPGPARVFGAIQSAGNPAKVHSVRCKLADEGDFIGPGFFGGTVADGSNYEIAGLKPGRYELWTWPENSSGIQVLVDVVAPETRLDVDLPSAQIEGRVTGIELPDGAQNNVNVSQRDKPVSGYFSASVSAEGQFLLKHIKPGAYEFHITDKYGRVHAATTKVTRADERVSVELKPTVLRGWIAGYVRGGGKADPRDETSGYAQAYWKDDEGYDFTANYYGPIRPRDGAFQLRDLPIGRYGLLIGNGPDDRARIWIPEVEVRDGLVRRVEVDRQPGREIALRFKSTAERPFSAHMRVRMPDGAWLPPLIMPGLNVTASTENISVLDGKTTPETCRIVPGKYAIELTIGDARPIIHEFEVVAGDGVQEITIALP